ncbi:6-phosphogluconolactonase 1 [Euphorbia peplus]|nr:6-phosphogluconolactonase 1 [Euphorbia peplus]
MPFTKVPTKRGELRIHENLNDLACHLAEYIAELSEKSYLHRGFFAIALSDDELISLLGKLCESPYTRTVEWYRWYICWADARLVDKTHVDGNYKQARDEFLFKIPVASSHVHSIKDSVTAEKAAKKYEYQIQQLVKYRTISPSYISDNPKFDLILLGMGSDGHVASLFPNHPVLDPTTTDWVTYITDAPEFPPERVTFTLPVINAAANVAIVVTGEDKAEAVHLVIDDVAPDADSPQLPARMVQPAEGKLVWFLDKAAASKLDCYKPPEDDSASGTEVVWYWDKVAASKLDCHNKPPSSE